MDTDETLEYIRKEFGIDWLSYDNNDVQGGCWIIPSGVPIEELVDVALVLGLSSRTAVSTSSPDGIVRIYTDLLS